MSNIDGIFSFSYPPSIARQARIGFPGAFYHVMARGDRREPIFVAPDGDDQRLFLQTLADACGRGKFRIWARVLMRNHYHLVLETPKANLVDGMGWLQNRLRSASSKRFPSGSSAERFLWPLLRPSWMQAAYGLDLFGLKDTAAGRCKFVDRLDARAVAEEGRRCGLAEIEGQTLNSTQRRGWYRAARTLKAR